MRKFLLLLLFLLPLAVSAQKRISISYFSPYEGMITFSIERSGKNFQLEAAVPALDAALRQKVADAMLAEKPEPAVQAILLKAPQKREKIKVEAKAYPELEKLLTEIQSSQLPQAALPDVFTGFILKKTEGKKEESAHLISADAGQWKKLFFLTASAFSDESVVRTYTQNLEQRMAELY